MLAADARTVPDEALRAHARHWLTAGARVVCAWGPACGRVHDAFDEAALALGLNHENAVVNTTWHQGEALREVVWFAIHTIAPDEAYPDADDALVAIAVGSKGWEAEMRAYLRAGALIVDQT